jgi:hypothetical protein
MCSVGAFDCSLVSWFYVVEYDGAGIYVFLFPSVNCVLVRDNCQSNAGDFYSSYIFDCLGSK